MNLKCLKLRSNSGRKLLDNQLQYIANQHCIPMSFLTDMRAKNFSKIFFEMSSTEIELIGYTLNDRLELLDKYRKVPEIIKAQISIMETIPIPKGTVNPNNVNKSSSKTDNALVNKNKKQADSSKQNTNNSQNIKSNSPSHTDKRRDNAELDFNFILKINLKQSDEELLKLCEKTTLDFDFLKENSERFSVLYYLQVAKNRYVLFAYSRRNSSKIELMMNFCEDLFQMKFTAFISNQRLNSNKHEQEIKNQLDVDDILDKIQANGINSLSKTERDFLESLADKSEQIFSFKNPRTRKMSEVFANDDKVSQWNSISISKKDTSRLPNIDELEAMYEQLHKKGIGNFKDEIYWSATPFSADAAWYFDFKNGRDGTMSKKLTANIRLIKLGK